MSLRQAFEGRLPALRAATTTYQQSFASVSEALAVVAIAELPVLLSPPESWSQLVSSYVDVQAGAGAWAGAMTSFCEAVPNEIEQSITLISNALASAQTNAAALAANPGDSAAQSALSQALAVLSAQIGVIATAIEAAAQGLVSFDNTVPGLVDAMNALLADFTAAVAADAAVVTVLDADIVALANTIHALQVGISQEQELANITLWFARLTPAAHPVLIGLKLFFIALSAVDEYYADLAAAELAQAQTQLAQDLAAASAMETDIAACQSVITACQVFAGEVSAFQAGLTAIVDAWDGLASDAQTAVSDASAALQSADAQAYAALVDDLSALAAAWTNVVTAAAGLVLDMQMCTTPLAFGGTEADIAAAVAAGGVPLLQFVTDQLG